MRFKDIQATIVIDLTHPEEELWGKVDKKARWGVKKAEKEGLKFEEIGKELWQQFYKIYRITCKQGEIPPISYEELAQKNRAHLFVAKKDEKIIAGSLVLEAEDKILLELNASLPEYLYLQPNNLLYWNIILWGKKNKFKTFDLGGYQLNSKIGSKLYEINRFKERWGGQIKEYYIYSYNPCYILGRKIVRNFPLIKKLRDKVRLLF
ncbi:peptidoglycan bridge formation glycyltransferase FemA/FemB family protein [Candidatus Woesearchaeota archaeon]|nr:peptidoglycan bridge formation glycyltransferase FemA/FemB family protein [Candidatus Woesearchaeota archaeon]